MLMVVGIGLMVFQLSYMVFTGLFSYFVLVQLAPTDEKDSPSLEEYLTWVWCGTMMLEEIRQVGHLPDMGL